jgi:alkylhydroperoxidase family enzyme
MGHQELKLAVAGLEDDSIAALDGDWSQFSEAERAAFTFAKELTHSPHTLSEASLAPLRKHYSDLAILEMLFSISGNNSTTRWKEAIGVMQEREATGFLSRLKGDDPGNRPLPVKSYITPTSQKFQNVVSLLAPALPAGFDEGLDAGGMEAAQLEASRRPPLESRAEVERMLERCAARSPRLPLLDDEAARAVLGDDWPAQSYPQWSRLLANFPKDGKARILGIRAAEEKSDVDPLLLAQTSWIAARQDRAWYQLGRAKAKLLSLAQSEEEIYALDGDWSGFSPAQRAAFHFTRRLMRAPDLYCDKDTADLVELLGPRDTTQLINHAATAAFLNRLTEAAGLPLEP